MIEATDFLYNRYKSQLSTMLEDSFRFRVDWLRKHNWFVVPVEDQQHFSTEQITHIVRVADDPPEKLFAVDTEGIAPARSSCYEFDCSINDFQSFNKVCGMFFYLVSDQKCSWAISCNNEYNLFAGKRDVLEAMLGCSVISAEASFLEYAARRTKPVKEDLVLVSELYKSLNSDRY